jgi:hypothetical protein
VKHLAGDVAGQARQTAETALSARKDAAVEGVRSVAEALRHTSEHLRSQQKGALTDYVGKAADRVEQASRYLQSRTLGEVIHDAEDFGRREPALFLGGAFVAGLVSGRFLKSSGPSRSQQGRETFGSQSLVPRRELSRPYGERGNRPAGDARMLGGAQGRQASGASSSHGGAPQESFAHPEIRDEAPADATSRRNGGSGAASGGSTRPGLDDATPGSGAGKNRGNR